MLRFVLIAPVFLVGAATPAFAEPVPGRADLIAERLAEDPVLITDHAPRKIPADAGPRIRAQLARLGVPVYLVVEPSGLPEGPEGRPDELIPLLHDRLRKDGVYIVTTESGSGAARQYGGSLPVDDAWDAAMFELPYDADVVRYVETFVAILTSPDVRGRIEQARARAGQDRDDEEDDGESPGERRDRIEMTLFFGGMTAGGAAVIGPLAWRRIRRPRAAAVKGGRR
ncbi:hypothetical protein [Thermomonospora amylolytica]|uniref:hypothetical protein n=1 Tax=Thermomonospora amylolytica TaxID=1411117 RepID=UPI000E6B6E3C|nr:hypothetical protein [Thermomonospora amylolytica]